MQERAFRKAENLSTTRILLEILEEALADIPKYIVSPGRGEEKSDIWFNMPSLGQGASSGGGLRKIVPGQDSEKGKMKITDEDDLIDALLRFQQEQGGGEQ